MKMKWLTAAFLLFVSSIAGAKGNPHPNCLIFENVNVISMAQKETLTEQNVLVQKDLIREMGPADTKLRGGCMEIDATGKYLIPGLTDMHVHLTSPIDLIPYYANGVTTVFNLDGRPAHLKWRDEITQGQLVGPTIYSTGPIINVSETKKEAVKLIDDQFDAGYDGIKIYNGVGSEEYSTLIQEAKSKHMLLMGHIARKPGVATTLQNGQSIAHCEEFTYTYFNPQQDDKIEHIVFDETKIPGLAKAVADSGVSVTCTISMFRDILRQATQLNSYLKNPELQYVAPWILKGLQPGSNKYDNRYSPEVLKQLQTSYAFQQKLIKAFVDAGVPLMTGTDSMYIGPVGGFSEHEELEEFVRAGLTPWQALETATVNPAKYFHRENAGTIEVGKIADLVLLDADPLADIRNARQIAGVVLRGRWYNAPALKKMLDSMPSQFVQELQTATNLIQTDPAKADNFVQEHDPFGRLTATVLGNIAESDGVPRLLTLLERIHGAVPDSEIGNEETMNNLGYELLGQKKNQDAIHIFESNVKNFPKSTNALDSLAEAYSKSGDIPKAVEFYQKALDLDPQYGNSDFAAKYIAEHRDSPQSRENR
jgi:imidazolonepropionase-like amidohydrolase